jgi:DNA invertase Pin-like site-specific DNA recombinase
MKAAAYIRVSTENQVGEDRYGLASQRADIEAYAAREGHEIVYWFSDEGISGGTLDRPGLQDVMSHAGEFSAVLVAKTDRLSRDLMMTLWIEKELLKAGVEILSVSEPFRGQDPANVLFRQIIGAFAQFEKSRITERMSGGRKQKASRGGYAGGGSPLGYRVVRGSKVLHVDDEKAETVKRVFAIKAEWPGATLQRIADILNAEGHRTAQGRPFGPTQVMRVLDREDLYRGIYSYAGLSAAGQHDPIMR